MITDTHQQPEVRQRRDAERMDLQQSAQLFMRSLVRTGVSFALLPVKRLPHKPQQHFQAAGREFTHGVATLVQELAAGIEEMTKETGTTTPFKEDPQREGELD
jgi:hypothetical protein